MRAQLLHSLIVLAALAAAIGAVPNTAQAQLGFTLYRAGLALTEEDRALVESGVAEVLEAREVGAQSTWWNPETALAGTAELTRVYEDEGVPCGSVAIALDRDEREAVYELNFCRTPDGTWGIAPTATPP